MDNQHRQIKGYRELSQEEINLMNEVKGLGIAIELTLAKVQAHLNAQQEASAMAFEEKFQHWLNAEPMKWLECGKGSLQSGLMFVTRSIAQPEFF